jgi:hypothetical protein
MKPFELIQSLWQGLTDQQRDQLRRVFEVKEGSACIKSGHKFRAYGEQKKVTPQRKGKVGLFGLLLNGFSKEGQSQTRVFCEKCGTEKLLS